MKSYDEIRPKFVGKTLVDDNRLKLIYSKVIETKDIPGDMAEIGVYKGGSSYLIASTNPDKKMYACDSFEGLPATTPEDQDIHHKGDFADTTFKAVSDYLLPLGNVTVKEGFFPNPLLHDDMYCKSYSFVHLDVDLYKPTIECLEFFWPRMSEGAVLVSDDYLWRSTPGVKVAFDQFSEKYNIKVIDSGHNSCYIVKGENK